MSLYLPEQKLGSHSLEGGSSNKFILKGRQTGNLHRGHTWVFRAESHETMMAWYEDIKALTEKKSAQERNDFVRGHVRRTLSRSSQRPGSSLSSDGINDEEDEPPFQGGAAQTSGRTGAATGNTASRGGAAGAAAHPQQQSPFVQGATPQQDIITVVSPAAGSAGTTSVRRPQTGGRFPSDLQVNAQRGLQVGGGPGGPVSPASSGGGSSTGFNAEIAAAATLPGSGLPPPVAGYGNTVRTPLQDAQSAAAIASREAREDGVNPYTSEPIVISATTGQTPPAASGKIHAGYGAAADDWSAAPQVMTAAAPSAGGGSGSAAAPISNGAAGPSQTTSKLQQQQPQQQMHYTIVRDISPMSGSGSGRGQAQPPAAGSMTAVAAATLAASRRTSSSAASADDSASVDSSVVGGVGPTMARYRRKGAGPSTNGAGEGVPVTNSAAPTSKAPLLTTMTGPSAPANTADSVQNTSHLHIPGEFPTAANR